MYVGGVMHRDIISVRPETSLNEAIEIARKNKIKHLIVFDKHKKLVGIVSSHDLKQTIASPATSLSVHELNYLIDQITVGSFMSRDVITVTPDTTVERAAYIMQTNSISALPVVNDGQTLGIITSTDVMGVLLDAIGLSDDTMRLIVFVKDRIGAIAEVTSILRDHYINIESLITWPEKSNKDICQLVMRIYKRDKEKAIFALTNEGYKVLTRYVEDPSPYF